ncbi:MAG TPA: hypothetical protein VFC55_01565, partial [Desulfobaccales bacterium]|nr:hypothetical protein [Desulfobaccales bacterium]
YYLYAHRPAQEPLRQGFHEFLFSGLYLDRLYQVIFVGPYQRMTEFMKRRVEEQALDESYVKGAASFVTLSRGLGYWTTGRLSTYVKMVLLGLTVLLIALVWGWCGS